MQQQSTRPTFRGDGQDTISGKNFLRSVRHQIRALNLTGTDEVNAFEDYLVEGTPCEEWWEGLSATDKATWDNFAKLFLARWPSVTPTQKTTADKIRALCAHAVALTEDDLGTKVMLNGVEVEAHTAWAVTALRLAAEAGKASSDEYLVLAEGALPRSIRRGLRGTTYTTWQDLTNAVSKVDPMIIKDAMEERQAREETIRAVSARLQPRTTTQPDELAAAFGRMSMGPAASQPRAAATPARPAPARPAAATAPVGAAPTPAGVARYVRPQAQGGATNRAGMRQPQQELTPAEKERLRGFIDSLPHHANDAQGVAAWEEQKRLWRMQYSDGIVRWDRPYPLQPGTAPVCTGECFKCGMNGHMSVDCPVRHDRTHWISRGESDWRHLCMGALGAFRKDTIAAVCWLEESENGEGSST
ncbi:hypothetical protein BD626DRAFT_627293 [Schizophyllum amplum]|uniref:CCHC-type domain-containing protein n=1 Tax=Schizophyllum amplum TaxID=97359 RepID=A0A550CPS7_9AGAR|nr:hypothetical protein BD626DRAFT_627293 [Auriculariopsis ampla]